MQRVFSRRGALLRRAKNIIGPGTAASIVALGLSGCTTPAAPSVSPDDMAAAMAEPEVQKLKEGDTIRIAFPSAPNLDTTQVIRHDGRISLYIIGELHVSGMTPQELEELLLQRYENQLNSREVFVSLVSSQFTVKIGGAVPSIRIQSDRPLTAFEAVMESGAFSNPQADTRQVEVRRIENGQWKTFTLNLDAVLQRTSDQVFYLKPNDIIFVPKRFSMF